MSVRTPPPSSASMLPSSSEDGPRAPSVEIRREGGGVRLVFAGAWLVTSRLPKEVSGIHWDRTLQGVSAGVTFDTAALTAWDSRFLVLCRNIMDAAARQHLQVDTAGLPAGVIRLLELAASVPVREGSARGKVSEGPLAQLGGVALALWDTFLDYLNFVGETAVAVWRLVTGRAVLRRVDVWEQIRMSGAEALPIVSLISVLVGLILAYVGAVQLRMFGAQVYVASLVGIAMARVMGAVMTGVIMAGRTGASFAAELGSMQVNEEIDALTTLGVSPMEFLVLPRLVALTVMMPLLCLYADFMGMLGGFIVGVFMLNIAPGEYITFTRSAVDLPTIWIGVFHSVVFGVLVSMAGCFQGMRCGRSASAVGKATTSAVVTSIVAIVVATAIITVSCDILGI